MTKAVIGVLFLLALAAARAQAQDPTPAQAAAPEQRPTGLPARVHWTFNFDAGLGTFGFANSLFTDVRPDPAGNLSDNWAESYAKPALSAEVAVGRSHVYGKVSAVGERTFMAPPSLVGESASSFQVEDLFVGWRSGTSVGGSENLLDFTVGRAPYTIGHGLLLWDGAGEGGSRGGYWSNVRKAWALAAIARVKPAHHTLEAFYLERDEVPESRTGTRLWGLNFDLTAGAASTFGASYLRFSADPEALPDRDGMTVFNVRAYTAPLPSVSDLSVEFEYAREQNGDLLRSNAWTLQAGYELSQVDWTPKVSYRYALFEGDDAGTPTNEEFDMLLPGFYDWGTWWQGEIAGEYFLANSDLVSHQVRVHLAPTDAVGTGLIVYKFRLDQLAPDPDVTSKDVAVELDWYMDWTINGNFTVSFVGAFANPGAYVQQALERTKNFSYGMIYLAYAY